MSQENVEIVKLAMEAYNRRDVDDYAEILTPDFELFPAVIGVLEGVSFRGREGVERHFAELSDTWEEIRVVPEELRDLGDRVLLSLRMEGRGRGSGVPVTSKQWSVIDFRDGKVSRIRSYLDHDDALRAAGLAE